MRLGNLNLSLEKHVILFEFLAQKGETDKEMAGPLCYKY